MTNPYFILAAFRTSFWTVHFQALMMKKLRCKYYNKRIINRDTVSAQSHDQSKLNGTINVNSDAHTLTHDILVNVLVYHHL